MAVVAAMLDKRNLPPAAPNEPPKNQTSTQVLVRKLMETKSKMAGVAALYFFPKCRIGVECLTRRGHRVHVDHCISHRKIGSIDPGICNLAAIAAILDERRS
jgi:hypothetical protein